MSFSNLGIRTKLSVVVGTFAIVIAILLLLSFFAMNQLSTVRAFVGGEGLWSKSQKDAIYYLAKYAQTHDEMDFEQYQRFLRVPLGDKTARLELLKDNTNYDVVDKGLIEGRNHPADVRAMGQLIKRFRSVSYIEEAMATWKKGDEILAELSLLGDNFHSRVARGGITPSETREFLASLDKLNTKLTVLEDHFSSVFSEAARWMKGLLGWVMVICTLLFLGIGLLIAYIVSRRVVDNVLTLRHATARIGSGHLDERIRVTSSDELGQLAISFNKMAENLVDARDAAHHAKEKLAKRAQELADANQKILEHEKLKSEFFSNISHELRTPLALIMAPLESLLSGEFGTLKEQGVSMLKMMHNNVVRLLQMVQGLLDFQKLEANKVKVEREPTDLGLLTKSLFDDFDTLMKQRGLHGECAIDPSIEIVDMDRYLYERILFNLLSNAIKFTQKGGTIRVRLEKNEQNIRLEVEDTGIGIESSDVSTLFKKFKQVEGAATRRFEGSGLGLALIKEFAELLGGKVEVASTPGKGSKFSVVCFAPRSVHSPEHLDKILERQHARLIEKYEIASHDSVPPVEKADDSLPSVVVAEDNVELAQYISTVLSGICHVKLAKDGDEALKIINKNPPDLIISDVMMPHRDGLSLCREVKSSEATRQVPFVLLTALTYRAALLRGWEAGADDYLFKPFHPEELQVRIRALLSAQKKLKSELNARQKIEQTLKERESQFLQAQKTQAVGQLAGGVAHDFNNLLTIVMGSVDVALQNLDQADKLTPALNAISECADRAASLTRQLLAFSRQQIFNVEKVDLNQVVVNTAKMVRRLIGENIALTTQLDSKPVVVMSDKGQLEQVIINLCVNARDAMPKGGKLSLETGHIEFGKGRVPPDPEIGPGHYALLCIRDTGTGMNQDTKARIFEPFFTTKEFGKGTGLGLSTTYGIVKQSGGHVVVDSELGRGTTFYVYFPLIDESVPFVPKSEDISVYPSGSETILLVEDEETVRNIISRSLKSKGYRVLTAASPQEALAFAEGNLEPIDVILTDVVMPEMDGAELAARLKRKIPSAEVIYMSGYTDHVALKRIMLEDRSHFFQKPFTPGQLLKKIRNILDRRQRPSALGSQ